MVMIPVSILLLGVGGIVGGLPALLVGWLTSLMSGGALPWVLGLLIGIPVFILVVAVPLAFLGGLWEVFSSSIWTLFYRELPELEARAA
jgi:hypothetical protein